MKTVDEMITALQALSDIGEGGQPVVLVAPSPFDPPGGEYIEPMFIPITKVIAPAVTIDAEIAGSLGLPGDTCILLGTGP